MVYVIPMCLKLWKLGSLGSRCAPHFASIDWGQHRCNARIAHSVLLGTSMTSLIRVIVWDSESDAFNAAMPAAASQARHCSSMFVNTLQVLTDPSALDRVCLRPPCRHGDLSRQGDLSLGIRKTSLTHYTILRL